MKLSSNKNTSILLLVLLITALLFAVYYYIVLPKKEDVASLENSVDALQSEITTLQAEAAANEEQAAAEVPDSLAIRQKLPQSREIDQLLLNLEEIEFVSETSITAIDFNSYDALVSESAIAPTPEEDSVEETTEIETAEELTEEELAGEETGETPVSEMAAEALPQELKLITFNIEVEAAEYENLLSFIKEMENLQRIMHVDAISYSLPGEEAELTEEDEILNASIQITTFYHEGES